MKSVDIMLKEYETLRQEILTAMQGRHSILSFGQATIGVLFAASAALYAASGQSLFLSLVLSLVVPSIGNFTLFMWLGEYQRMQRAGRFLVDLERRINDRAQDELLTWETHLREQRRHMRYPYKSTVVLLTVINAVSLLVGLVMLDTSIVMILILAAVGGALHFVICRYAMSSMSRLRS